MTSLSNAKINGNWCVDNLRFDERGDRVYFSFVRDSSSFHCINDRLGMLHSYFALPGSHPGKEGKIDPYKDANEINHIVVHDWGLQACAHVVDEKLYLRDSCQITQYERIAEMCKQQVVKMQQLAEELRLKHD